MAIAVAPREAAAQTLTTWDGSSNTTFNTKGNFSPQPGANLTTTSTNLILVFANTWGANGGTAPTLNANATVNALSIQTGTTFSIGGAFTLGVTSTTGLTRSSVSSGTQTLQMSTFSIGANQTWDINGSGLMVISGTIDDGANSYNLTKTGTGVLLLSGANTFSGTTTVSGGTLRLGNVAALQNSTYSTGGSGTLSFGSLTSSTFGGLVGSVNLALTNTASGNVALSVGNNNASTTYSGTLSGGGSLTKVGTGQFTLSGQNAYTGTTAILSGTLSTGSVVVSGGASGLGNATTAVTLGDAANEGTLSYTGVSGTFSRGFALGAGGGQVVVTTAGQVLTIGGTGNVTSTSGTFTIGGAGDTTVSSTLAMGTGGLTKEGAGTLTLSAPNTYTGLTTISGGTLAYGIANAISSGGVTVGGGVLDINGFGDTVGVVTLTSGSIIGTGTLTGSSYALQGGAVNAVLGTGAITVSTGTTTLGSAGRFNSASALTVSSGQLSLGGNETVASYTQSGGTLGGSGTLTGASYALQGGAVNAVLGTGAITVSTGTTTLGSAGRLNSASALTLSSGQLSLGGNESVGSFSISGGTLGGSGTLTTGTYALGGGTVAATLGTGTMNVTASTTLSGTANATAVNLNSGTLTVSNLNGLSSSAVVSGSSTGALSLGANQTIGSLAGAANVALGTGTLTVGGLNTTTTYSGTMSGSGGLTKNGSGGLTLSAANTYSGLTTVSGGTLALGVASALGTGAVTINNGATLDMASFNDTVGAVTLTDGSIIGTTGTLTGASYAVSNGTISAILGGAVNLTKSTSGTVTLSAANAYSGTTTISAGALRATTSANALGTGTLALNGGNLELANNTGLNFARPTIITASGTIFSERLAPGAGVTHTLGTLSIGAQTLTLDTDSSVTSGTAGLTFGNVTLTGAATLNANAGTLLTTGTVAGNFALAIGGNGNTTIAGFNPATTNQTLTKSGSGTLTLSATSGYTGLTTISGGTLAYGVANALSTGSVTLNGGALDISTFNDSVGQVTLTSGNIVGTTGTLTSTANFNTNSGTISAILAGTGFGIAQGTGTTVVTSSNAFTGNSSVALGGVLNLRNAGALGTTGTATVSSGGALQLENSGTLGRALSLNGTGISSDGALRNISGTNGISAGITLAGATRINSDADLLTLSGTIGGATQNLTFGGAGNITVSNTIATTTGSLTKDGAGTLTLSAANTYTGTTGITAGVLNVQNATALGTSSAVTVASGGELQLQNGITISRPLTLTGTGVSGSGALRSISGANTYSGTITTAVSAVGIGVDSGTLTLSGSLSGSNQLIKYGSGLLVLTGTDGISGAHTINSGTFQIGSTGALGPVAMTIESGATLDLNGRTTVLGATTNPNIAMTGATISTASGTLIMGGTSGVPAVTLTTNASPNSSTISGNLSLGGTSAVFNVNDGAAADDLVISAVISNGSLTKSGSGQMKLTGTNTYGGATTVNAGTLLLGANSVLSGSTAVTVAGGVLDNGGFTNSVGSFTITSGSYTGAGTLTAGTYALQGGTVTGTLGAGTLNVTANSSLGGASNASTVNLDAGTLTLTGANVLSSTAAVTGSSGGSLALGGGQTIGSLSGSAAVGLGSNTLTVGGASTTTYSGTLSGAGGLTRNGGGKLTLAGANTYGGQTTVSGGTLALGANSVLSGSTAVSVSGTGVLDMGTFTNTVGGFSITGGTLTGSTGNKLTAGTYGLGGGTVAGNLGTGTVSVTANSTLNGTSDASVLNLNTGTLTLGAGGTRFTSPLIAVSGSSGGSLGLGGNETIGSLNGAAGVALGSNTLTTGSVGTNDAYSGVVAGTGNLVKVGSGTFTLSGNNSFSGTTSISAGAVSVGSVAAGATNQPLGTGNTLNLGVNGASSGRLFYTGGSGTLSKNVNALGNGTDTIQNAGTGLLTLSGTLQKNGTILRLQGGSQGITVTGVITGTSQNSDLAVQNGLTTLSTTGTYNGPTFINSSGTLALGINNAIPSNSAVTIGGTFAGGDNGPGTLNMVSFTNAIGSLAFSGSGGTVKMAPTASATSTIVLSATGAVNLVGTTTLDLTGMATGAGLYQLIKGSSLTDQFDTVTGLDSNYVLRYGTLTTGQLDAQRKANQATTFTMTTGTVTRALVNTNVTVSGTVTNSSPVNSTALTLGLASTGLTGSGFTTGNVTSGSSLAVSGTLNAGGNAGTQNWSITNTDNSAIQTTSTATGSLQVVNQRSFSVTSSTVALGRYLITSTLPSGTTGVSSTGSNAVTANATLGSFSSSNGYSLSLTSGTNTDVFNGATASQTAAYTVSGSATSAGLLSGSFSSNVTAEFGSINPVVVNYTANPVNQRTFTTSTSTLALGYVHQGGSFSSPTVTITSTGLNNVAENATLGSFTGGASGFTLGLTSGTNVFSGTAATQSTVYTLSGSTASLGAISGTYTSTVAAEFSPNSSITVAVSGQVYSGQSTWATNGGGNWGTFASGFGGNWGTNQGSPGLDAAFANTDTATFGSALTSGTAAINSNGATISLKSITFNNAAGSYELYQTGGGPGLTLLAAGTNAAAVNVAAGSHAIHSDVTLGSNTVVDVASGAALTFHDAISGSASFGLTKTGLGTLYFNGNGTYAGNTTISQGVVSLLSGVNPLGTGTVTVASGATLDLNYRGISNTLNVLAGGILLNSGSGQSVTVKDLVYFSGTTNGTVNVTSGGVADFQSGGVVGALVTVNAGGNATFASGVSGLPSVNVLGGGSLTVAGTAAGSYQVAGSGTFSGPLVGDLDVLSGGVVAFNGSNGPGSTFNVASGGLVNVSSAASIGGQLHVSGSAVIAGTVLTGSNVDVIVQSGGYVKLVDGASFGQTTLANAGNFVINGTSAFSLATNISGSGSLQKLGTGVATLTGTSTFTGPTSLDGGKLLVNGSLASDVAAAAGTILGGSGSIAGTLSGSGLVSPGNSPGILTAGVFDPTGGLDAAFEFTALAPNYANSGAGALNDVLRLTDVSPFAANLGAGNLIDVYFNVTPTYQQTYEGGFFTTLPKDGLLTAIQHATFAGWVQTNTQESYSRVFNGNIYNPIYYTPGLTGIQVRTRDLTTNFGSGLVTGSVTQFIIVPEPNAALLGGLGILAAVGRFYLRRQRICRG